MAISKVKPEMKGDTSRWTRRADAKNSANKIRREVDKEVAKEEEEELCLPSYVVLKLLTERPLHQEDIVLTLSKQFEGLGWDVIEPVINQLRLEALVERWPVLVDKERVLHYRITIHGRRKIGVK